MRGRENGSCGRAGAERGRALRSSWVGLAILVALGLAVWWSLRVEAPDSPRDATAAVEPVEPDAVDAFPTPAAPATIERTESAPVDAATPLPPEEPVEIAATGIVRGRVVDPHGNPVAQARVVAGDRWVETAPVSVDERGAFAFELPLGRYGIKVDGASLPPLYVPPHVQDRFPPHFMGTPPGLFAALAVLERPGDTVDVLLTVNFRNVVSGYVFDSAGNPVEDVNVRFQNLQAGYQGVHFDDLTDSSGYYQFDAVHPGRYRPEISMGRDHRLAAISRPFLVDVDIGPAPLQMAPIILGVGPKTLTGRVVDQDGEPFPDLNVMVFVKEFLPEGAIPYGMGAKLALVSTDVAGRWTATGIPSVRVGIQVSPDGARPGRDDRLLARFVPQITLDLKRLPDAVDTGTQVAERSRPFRLSGRIEVTDPALQPSFVKVWIEALDGQLGDRRDDPPNLELLEVDHGDGTFSWRCETPFEAVVLTVTDRLETSIVRREVVPRPNEHLELVVQFPGNH